MGTFDCVEIKGITNKLFIPCKLEISQSTINFLPGYNIHQMPNSYEGHLELYPKSSQQGINLINLCRGRRKIEIQLSSDHCLVNLYDCVISGYGGGKIEFTFNYHVISFEDRKDIVVEKETIEEKLLEFDDGI